MTGSERAWERVSAACALWRIDGDPHPVLPVFRTAWTTHARTRGRIVRCLAGMGFAGAPLWDLLETEVASERRHTARPGGYGSHDIPEDERLLRVCREVLRGRK
ncbi:hypothetical protein [Streptomyces brasiliensis]|nr:hypothetical protein [Streptomyces brasiliensis]